MSSLKGYRVVSVAPKPRIDGLITMMFDWYWELDTEFRFTSIAMLGREKNGDHFQSYIGKKFSEVGFTALYGDSEWVRVDELMAARKPVLHFMVRMLEPDTGAMTYYGINGEPAFDMAGNFIGYRGIGVDVTATGRAIILSAMQDSIPRCFTGDAISSHRNILQLISDSEMWSCGAFWQFVGTERAALEVFVAQNPAQTETLRAEYLRHRAASSRLAHVWLGELLLNRSAVWFDDVRSDNGLFRATLLLPIFVQGKLIGVYDFTGPYVRQAEPERIASYNRIAEMIGHTFERQQAERALRESEERFRSLVELSSDWYWRTNQDHQLVEMAGRLEDDAPALIGSSLWHRPDVEIVSSTHREHQAALDARRPFHQLVLRYHQSDGGVRYTSVSGEPIFDGDEKFSGYRGVARDITERKLDEDRITYLANHDVLTGLPNRASFNATLANTVAVSQRYGHRIAVLFIDLDGFKNVNDTLGHDSGDTLLKEVARRLLHAVRKSDTVARLGGDEFVVLMPQVGSDDDMAAVARKILAALIQPVAIDGVDCRVTASIGISRSPDDADIEHAMMRHADIAMYRAKEKGKNTFEFFEEDPSPQAEC